MDEEKCIVIGNVYVEGVDYFDVEAKIDEGDEEDLHLILRFKLQIEDQFITIERWIWITEPTLLRIMCETLEKRAKELKEEEAEDANRSK